MDAINFVRAGVVMLAAGAAAARPDYTYTGPAVPIPDGTGPTTAGAPASISISVPDSFTVATVVCAIYVPHPFQGDVVLTLSHVESGRSAVLVDRPYVPQSPLGFAAADYGAAGVMFVLDDAAASVYDSPAVLPPGIGAVSGTWKPQAALGVFAGDTAAGTWRLTATDGALGDTGSLVGLKLTLSGSGLCYPNCDGTTAQPFLNILDFSCFLNKFAAADTYANCDGSTLPPALNILDFSCFINKFAAGCSAP